MTTSNKGTFVWYEHFTRDPKAAIAFYTEVFGWTIQPFGQGSDYAMWVNGQGPLGGVMSPPAEDAPLGWYSYVHVEDVDASVALVQKLGGTVLREAGTVPTVGRFAFIADPQGAPVALFTPAQKGGAQDSTKEGAFCWSELFTSDAGAAYQFYAELFGWKTIHEMDTGHGMYRLFGVGEKALGGMMTVPPGGIATQWVYYVESNDLDAALVRATAHGAKIMSGPMPVPDGGRIAQLTDPQGAWFAIHQQGKA